METTHYEVRMNGIRIYTFQSIKLNEDQIHSFDFDVDEYQPEYIPQNPPPPLIPENPLSNRSNPYEH
jgi:hypothetical protein